MFRRRLLAATRPAVETETWDYVWDYTMGNPTQYGFVERFFNSGELEVRSDGVLMKTPRQQSLSGYYMPTLYVSHGVMEVTAQITSASMPLLNGFRMCVSNGNTGTQICVRSDGTGQFPLFNSTTVNNQDTRLLDALPSKNGIHVYRLELTPDASSYWLDGEPISIGVPHATQYAKTCWVGVQTMPTEVLLRGIKFRIGGI